MIEVKQGIMMASSGVRTKKDESSDDSMAKNLAMMESRGTQV